MLVMRSWLEDYIELEDLSNHELADLLTGLGLEVEAVEHQPPFDSKIVVGKVMGLSPHPGADKLRLAEVDVAGTEPLEIVCGAANLAVGMKVAVALVGSKLPGGQKMKSSKIRGVLSAGMILAADELGLTDDRQDGIWPLGSDFSVGATLESQYPRQETLFDIAITPNRGDCLSYIGIARDLGAKLTRAYTKPKKHTSDNADKQPAVCVTVMGGGETLCSQYYVLQVSGLSGKQPSPFWLQRRLSLSGIRPKSLMVDLTNYILLEWGQPVHAFDARYLAQHPESLGCYDIRVGLATEGDSLTTLDGTELQLTSRDLIISSGSKPMALAGVMGGKDSEVSESSSEYIIEFAEFCSLSVRRSARRHRLHTESSHRFERGIDGTSIDLAVKRFASLAQELCPEAIISAVSSGASYQTKEDKLDKSDNADNTDNTDNNHEARLHQVALRVDRARKLLGLHQLTAEQCIDILDALECGLVDQLGSRLVVSIPGHRTDLQREVDLIEEIGRMIGYDSIPSSLPHLHPQKLGAKEHLAVDFHAKVVTTVASLGLTEVILYPFLSSADLKNSCLTSGSVFWPDYALKNPLGEAQYLPVTQVCSVLKAVSYNRRRLITNSRIFQMGRGYCHGERADTQTSHDPMAWWLDEVRGSCSYTRRGHRENKARELSLLTMAVDGSDKGESGFMTIKKLVESLLGVLGLGGAQYHSLASKEGSKEGKKGKDSVPFLHPRQSALISHGGEYFGYLGELHPEVCQLWDLEAADQVMIAELKVDSLAALAQSYQRSIQPPSKYPPCLRDLALVVNEDIQHDTVKQAIISYPRKKFFREARLFDVYSGSQVGPRKKSLAFNLTFSSSKGTLNDHQVDREFDGLRDYLEKEYGFSRRS